MEVPRSGKRTWRRWRKAIVAATLLGSAVVIAGCSTAAPVEEAEPLIELPAGWHNQVESEGEEVSGSWCADFGDPALGRLIDEVLEENLDLQIAERRLETAQALLRQRRASRHPRLSVGLSAEGERGRQGWEQDYEIEAPLSYEVDLWGRIRAQVRAAETDLEAMGYDLHALKLTMGAATAEHYYELARVRSELRLLNEQIEIAKTFLELTHVRHRQGMANAIDVVQQRQQIEQLRESRLSAELEEYEVLSSLAALLGKTPGAVKVETAHKLPESMPAVAEFLPADLLERRPDVQAARLRVAAADERVAAALAERLPRLQLSASLALQAMNVEQLFEFLFVTVAGALSQSLWEGGRLQARVEEERSIQERGLLEFSAVLLEAIREVEDTLARGQALREIERAQGLQLAAAREALELAREQYRAGILDYLRVLTALQSVQRLELAQLESRRELLSQRIELCRAAGGFWPEMERMDEE